MAISEKRKPWGKAENKKFWLAFPKEERYRYKYHEDYGGNVKIYRYAKRFEGLYTQWEWFKMPQGVYESRVYPKCKCGRRFVPIEESKECFYCKFTQK